ncbi:hypothetical protein Sfulv_52580 [Streptomyces fulvorobeus]|uniref:Uncharacterized protein n=1 Tax=Streptomyces fulvorobeus TaxID=284028 RepID=A0A7J0CDY2_9ACTN|nr:hypothetical protein Sfulv_52580 [Streptomyces fulvorobeus]
MPRLSGACAITSDARVSGVGVMARAGAAGRAPGGGATATAVAGEQQNTIARSTRVRTTAAGARAPLRRRSVRSLSLVIAAIVMVCEDSRNMGSQVRG